MEPAHCYASSAVEQRVDNSHATHPTRRRSAKGLYNIAATQCLIALAPLRVIMQQAGNMRVPDMVCKGSCEVWLAHGRGCECDVTDKVISSCCLSQQSAPFASPS